MFVIICQRPLRVLSVERAEHLPRHLSASKDIPMEVNHGVTCLGVTNLFMYRQTDANCYKMTTAPCVGQQQDAAEFLDPSSRRSLRS